MTIQAVPQMDLLEDGWVHLVDSLPGWESFTVELRADLVNGEPKVTGLRLEPRKGFAKSEAVLTANRLRTLPVTALAAPVYHWASLKPTSVGDLVDALSAAREALAATAGPRPEDHRRATSVEAVAEIYRKAQELAANSGTRRQAPRAAVCEALHISPRTADRYLSQARRAGLLPPYDESQR